MALPNVKTVLEDCRISGFEQIPRPARTILKSIPEMKFEKCREQTNTDPFEVLLYKMTGNYGLSSAALRGNSGNLITTPQISSNVTQFHVSYIHCFSHV